MRSVRPGFVSSATRSAGGDQLALGFRLGEPGKGGSAAVASALGGRSLPAASRTRADGSARTLALWAVLEQTA